MKTIIIAIISASILSGVSHSNDERYSLTVEVENLRNSKGVVQITLYNKDGSIPDEHFRNYFKMEKAFINNGKARCTFTNLPEGNYAVNIFHDENNNGRIDKGLILPKEGIGFSNHTSIGLTNRPSFKKASFVLNQNIIISISAIYF